VDVHPEGRIGTDRVAIVTGGSRGIGCEIARTLAGRGYAVVIGYASDQRAAEAAIDADPLLEATTWSIIEEDEAKEIWRIDAFPTSDPEARRLIASIISEVDRLAEITEP